jgi:hypothetical protein
MLPAITAPPPARGIEPRLADPRGLDFARRLDVPLKWLYASHRLGRLPGWAHRDVRELYARHIHLRTGGREPGDEARKGDLEAYFRTFDALIDDMAAQGFDLRHPVPISRVNALPYNGAHRLAAALALGSEIAWVEHEGRGGEWGDDWFRDHGFTLEERNLLLRAWHQIAPDQLAVALLWSPVERLWPDLERALAEAGYATVSARTLQLPPVALGELVRDVYAHDWGPKVGPAIEKKVGLLRGHAPRVRVVFLQQPLGATAQQARDLKLALREAARDVAPPEWFATLHLSESATEARHLLELLAHENSLRILRRRGALRPALVEMLAEMHDAVRSRGIAAADCCVVGGAVLDALGLRPADDVDFTLRRALRHQHFSAGIHKLGPRCDVVTEGYARAFVPGASAPSDDALIDDPSLHFIVRGLRVADPHVALARRAHQRRDKDLRDLPRLAGFIDQM